MTKKQLTIYDIAQKANVCPATVSKVINRHRGISAETVKRVNQVIEENHFRPRWKAPSSKNIGFLFPPYDNMLSSSYNEQILSACYDHFRKQNYMIQLLPPDLFQTDEGAYHFSAADLLDGIIVISAPPNYPLCRKLLKQSATFPCVIIGKLNDNIPNHTDCSNHILADDYNAGFQAATMLLRHNLKSFMLVASHLVDIVHKHRLEGCLAALRQAGIRESQITIREENGIDLYELGNQLAVSIATSSKKPEGIIFTNSSICAGFASGCNAMKVRIPDEISVIGFEDHDELKNLPTPITVMKVPAKRMGELAFQSMMAQIEHSKQPEPQLIPHTLIARQSVKMR